MCRVFMIGLGLALTLAWGATPWSPVTRLRHISQEESLLHEEVFTSGIVTYVAVPQNSFFLQDGVGAIFVRIQPDLRVEAGDTVEVRGRMNPGRYAPVIEARTLRITGTKPLPAPIPVEVPDLWRGDFHCVRIRIEGLVRAIDFEQVKPQLRIERNGHLIRVRVDDLEANQARKWIGRRVRVQGVASSVFNAVGQMTDAILYSASGDDIEVTPGQPVDQVKVMPIAKVMTFDSGQPQTSAVHVVGRVTYSRQDRLHVIQDESGGILVESASRQRLPLGSTVAVTGYVRLGGLAPSLIDATARLLPSARAIQPLRTTPEDLTAKLLQARLVSLDGTLVSASSDPSGGQILHFENGGREYSAQIDRWETSVSLPEPGSRFTVKGVAFLTGNAFDDPSHLWFRMQLRSAADLVMLAPAPYWNWRRTAVLSGLLIVGVLAALTWVMQLRRRVRIQTSLVERAAEQERQVKSSFQELFENASDLIFQFDARGRIEFANRAVSELMGYAAEELMASNFTLLLPRENQADWDRYIESAIQRGELNLRTERKLITRSGESVTVEFNCRILAGGDGGAVTVKAIGRDVTRRKCLEETLERARLQAEEANRAKGEFLAQMSHEIRTPMNGVRGMTELLLGTPLDSRQRNMAATIRDSSDALLRVINDILDFSKLEAGMVEIQPVSTDLRRVLEDVLDLLGFAAREKRLEVVFDYPPDLPRYFIADGGRIRQMVLNLVGNAVKFTDAGFIRIAVDVCQSPDLTQPQFTIQVEDSGVGIPLEKQALLFQRFQQIDNSASRRHGGSGLGLAITRSLVELMGGAMEVKSTPAKGSMFSFSIPLPLDTDAEAKRLPLLPLGGTVVVVDPLPPRHSVWQGFVRSFGQTAIVHTRVAEGLLDFKGLGAGATFLVTCAFPQEGLGALRDDLLKLPPDAQRRVVVLAWPDQRDFLSRADANWHTVLRPAHADHLYAVLRRVRLGISGEDISAAPEAASGFEQVGLQVLLAEDNAVNLRVATAFLERLGCQVDVAANGRRAVAMATEKTYDVVLMDCHMPEMDGYEATREIRSRGGRWASLPIIALTAAALPEDQSRCYEAGMNHYLAKPIDAHELERLLVSMREVAAVAVH